MKPTPQESEGFVFLRGRPSAASKQMRPEFAEAHYSLGIFVAKTDIFDGAIDQYEEAV